MLLRFIDEHPVVAECLAFNIPFPENSDVQAMLETYDLLNIKPVEEDCPVESGE
jgi:hypothetical protein